MDKTSATSEGKGFNNRRRHLVKSDKDNQAATKPNQPTSDSPARVEILLPEQHLLDWEDTQT